MKKLFLLLFNYLPLFSIGALCQINTSKIISDVKVIDSMRINALLNADTMTLSKIYSKDYELMIPNGEIRNKQQQISELAKGLIHYKNIHINYLEAHSLGNTVILVSDDETVIEREGKEVGGKLRFTRVYVKNKGRWYLISSHASRLEANK